MPTIVRNHDKEFDNNFILFVGLALGILLILLSPIKRVLRLILN